MHRNGSAKGILGIGNFEMIDAELSDLVIRFFSFFFFLAEHFNERHYGQINIF